MAASREPRPDVRIAGGAMTPGAGGPPTWVPRLSALHGTLAFEQGVDGTHVVPTGL